MLTPPLTYVDDQVLRWMGYSSGFDVQLMLVSEVSRGSFLVPWRCCLDSRISGVDWSDCLILVMRMRMVMVMV